MAMTMAMIAILLEKLIELKESTKRYLIITRLLSNNNLEDYTIWRQKRVFSGAIYLL
jgi:hypothetical protein